ncbi:GH92 family glycosyl hydrolase [Streptomyces sp. HNM0574]|uniref:GH92 family glycosyl hydrolase n=1 Tax=Streptomyces sp. HNM0574 TaxID=2714954 RepID=UPI00146E75E4|nr:GH92 family glycosyl hydrolase [Streptomyces sp. HNM0574]NLU65808.1 glycoside hydrolase family 92 protein [Streptomyces sp. HNM0574]
MRHPARPAPSRPARTATLLSAVLLVVTAQGAATAVPHPDAADGHTRFHSSFEPGEPAPDWADSVETAPDGTPRTGGVTHDDDGRTPRGMSTRTGGGPAESPTAKPHAGFTGLRALRYAGTHAGTGRGWSYNRVFDVDTRVTRDTVLSYRLFPEMPEGDRRYAATHASLDLAFTDGTYLSDLRARDQHGTRMSPRGQGRAKTLHVNQWNHREARIGRVAAGKTVDRVLLAYDNPRGGGRFSGWVDDVTLAPRPEPEPRARPSDHVVTTRGTHSSGDFSRGNTFPATAVPGGFNFWTPVTDAGSTDWLYEYARGNDAENRPTLQAFGASHEPSPWMGDRQTFQVMPSTARGTPDASRKKRALPFRHERETAKPHHYGVTFENGLRTEIAPADHAAMMRFTFPGDDASLIFDNVDDRGGLSLDTERGVVTGYSDVKSGLSTGATRMFVYAAFDAPVTDGGPLRGGGSGEDGNVTGYLRFAPGADRTVSMRIATSLISVEQAKDNLRQEIPEVAGSGSGGKKGALKAADAFDRVRERARRQWDRILGRVEVKGASEDQLTTLYSNLYRLYLYPNSGHERVGSRTRYASPFSKAERPDTPTETGSKIVDGEVNVNNGFWDTYRTTWPAYSLLTPERAARMADGFVQQYRDGGWISRWSSPGYADLMTGTSSDVAFADAYAKGVRLDAETAYEAALKNATVAPPDPGVGRKGMATSPFLGYTSTDTPEGMSWALEGYLNDSGIARMASALHRKTGKRRYAEEAAYFRGRAQNYVRHFDKRTGFFQGRKPDGSWRLAPDAYDPRVWGHDYTETNGWNFAFTAPQDTRGLAALHGGRAGLARKLDRYFATPETAEKKYAGSYGDVIHEMTEARDVRMGMYGHSNQPAHHIAYLYNAAGQPWKTQAKVREVLSRLYLGSEIGQGYPGDEDNGEMSAWHLFSALGFYPLVMGAPEYTVGSPLFTEARVRLGGGRELVVKAPGNSARTPYVQGLKVNGKEWTSTRLPHRLLARGATLEFDMGSEPSKWGSGKQDGPSSLSRDVEVPDPPRDVTAPGKGPLLDNTSATAGAVPGGGFTVEDGSRVRAYTLTSDRAGDAPRRWVLEGRSGDGPWTPVDRRRDERFRWDRQTRVFSLPEPARYDTYRLVPRGGGARLAEVELLG